MKLLYQNDLIFGRLLHISEEFLIARYRKAMEGFGLKPTALDEFHIDMTGFSPEIAEEMEDENYLDPLGINRRFVILSPEQEYLPVVHTKFSNTGALMHQFFKDNARALRAVTIKDALYGEIDDPVARVEDIDDLLSIEEVKFEVKSADSLLDKANELRILADRLTTSESAWRDDDMLNRMVEIAGQTGDIRQNDLVPQHLLFEQGSYWANHFGGVFVFKDERSSTVICDAHAPGFRRSRPWQVSYIDINDHKRILKFLKDTKRIQLPEKKWVLRSELLLHRSRMVIGDLIQGEGDKLGFANLDHHKVKSWIRNNRSLIAKDGRFDFFQKNHKRLSSKGSFSDHEFNASELISLSRANPKHDEKWLVNRLFARLMPFDFVTRFIFDKQGFYEEYQNYDSNFRAEVVSILKNTYLTDKKSLRDKLYHMGE